MPVAFSKLRRLRRELRYVPLPHVVGRQMVLESDRECSSKLWDLLADVLPEDARVISDGGRAFQKYGILDLTYLVAESATPDAQGGVPLRVLRDLGFLVVDDPRDPTAVAVAQDCVDDLLQEIADGHGRLYLRAFLDADWPDWNKRGPTGAFPAFPDGIWPCTFTVRGACFTNAPNIWAFRHFYL